MRKYLVLEQTTMALFDYLKEQNYQNIALNKFVCLNKYKFTRAIRKTIFFNTPFKKLLCYKWWKTLIDVDVVICFDSIYAFEVCKLIKEEFPQKRVILYFWNSIYESIEFKQFVNIGCEVWTYDQIQAKENDFKFNDTFLVDFHKDLNSNNTVKQKIIRNVFYIGKDKGRNETIKQCIYEFENQNVTSKFIIVSDEKVIQSEAVEYRHSHIDYFEMLKMIQSYDCVLDINAPHATGMTLRPLEALYSRKRLITTNKNIIESVLYALNKDNIFVLGIDDISLIYDFVNSKFTEPGKEVFDYYSFPKWVERFDL